MFKYAFINTILKYNPYSDQNLSTNNSFHVAFLYGGYKGKGVKSTNIVTSCFSGRGKRFDKQYGVEEFKTCHAERKCISCVKSNHMSKLSKATIYVFGFRRITDINSDDYGKLDSFIGKPCLSCCKMLKQVGITKVKYSLASGIIVSDHIDKLLDNSIISSGMRHLITTDITLWIKNKTSFDLIKSGQKTMEGRLYYGIVTNIVFGMIIKIRYKNEIINVQVKNVYYYKSFNLLLKENLKKCLPLITNITNGVKYYKKFYSNEMEKKYGVVGICI